MVVRHRLACLYNGFAALLASVFWNLFIREIECGKKNSLYETIVFSNMCAHLLWDMVYMKYNGFLDSGNLIHHAMGIISYGTGIYY